MTLSIHIYLFIYSQNSRLGEKKILKHLVYEIRKIRKIQL